MRTELRVPNYARQGWHVTGGLRKTSAPTRNLSGYQRLPTFQ